MRWTRFSELAAYDAALSAIRDWLAHPYCWLPSILRSLLGEMGGGEIGDVP
ncbi:hypothetical protein THIOKS11870004 [Thiocapsa sp. KS1]|nr:hypothetical protein THIOKS11870004 [Thiocapsa sp. KS1]